MTHPAKLAAAALHQVARVLDKLTEEQLTALAEGRAAIEFRMGDTVVSGGRGRPAQPAPGPDGPVDIAGVVATISRMTSRDEVIAYLSSRRELSLPVLREIARAVGPTVSASGGKAALQRNIAEGTVGFRQRSAAVFNRGW